MNDKMNGMHTPRKTGTLRQQAEAAIRLVRDTTAENASRSLMSEQSLENLIELGEGFTAEFKRSGTSGLGREICAFVNATGGTALIGVSDDGKIAGVAAPVFDVGEHWVTTTLGRTESAPKARRCWPGWSGAVKFPENQIC